MSGLGKFEHPYFMVYEYNIFMTVHLDALNSLVTRTAMSTYLVLARRSSIVSNIKLSTEFSEFSRTLLWKMSVSGL